MAKKLVIKLKNDRPNLIDDFTSWFKKHKTYSYGYYDDWDDYDGCDCWGLGWENNWGYPTDEDDDDDDYDWAKERQSILDWNDAYDKTLDDDTLYNDYWNRKAEESRKKKHGKRGKRGGHKREDIDIDDAVKLSNEEIDDILNETKTIYYYPDINQQDNVKKFKNLRTFFGFLDEQGIDISDNEGGKFIRSTVRHCCINPLKRQAMHNNEIISDHSYGALVYEVSEDATLLGD